MLAQPRGQRLRRAIGQEVDDLLRLQVDQDRAVGPPASLRPIVDTQHAHRPCRRGRRGAHEPQERAPTDRQPPRRRVPCPRRSPQGKPRALEFVALACGAPTPRCDQSGQALSEDRAAPAHATGEPTGPQMQGDLHAHTGQIGEGTISQGVSLGDLRQSRYHGLAKTRLLHLLIATALNFVRV